MQRTQTIAIFLILLSVIASSAQGSSLIETLYYRFLHLRDQILGKNVLDVCTKVECLSLEETCDPFGDGLPCECRKCLNEAQTCFDQVVNNEGSNLTVSENLTSVLTCNCFKGLKACLSATGESNCEPLAFLFQEKCRNGTGATTNGTNTNTTNDTCDCSVPEFDPSTAFSALTLRTCSMNAYCDYVSRTCQELKGEGEICRDIKTGPFEAQECGNSQRPFVTHLEYKCEEGRCERTGFANVTDGCSKNSDCYLHELGRVRCNRGRCRGVSQGGECDFSAECEFGLYCSSQNNTCIPQLRGGASCDPNEDDSCVPWLLCGLSTTGEQQCVRKLNSSEGDPCISTEQCRLGNFCWNNTCTRVPDTLEPCSDESDCPDEGFECKCDILEGRSKCTPRTALFGSFNIDASCQESYENALQCIQDHNCKHLLSTDLNSCPIRNCLREASCAILCAGETTLKPLIDAGCLELPSILSCNSTATGA